MVQPKLFYPSIKIRRPTPLRNTRFWLPALMVTLALMLGSSIASAHGEGFYLIRGTQVGPYVVHIWSAPGVLRTGVVHIDTAIFDAKGLPAFSTLVNVTLIPLVGDAPVLSALASPPDPAYPYTRDATLHIDAPGDYRLEIAISDANGPAGVTGTDVNVQVVSLTIKLAIIALGIFTTSVGIWLLWQTKAFWLKRTPSRSIKLHNLRLRTTQTKTGWIQSEQLLKGQIQTDSIYTGPGQLRGPNRVTSYVRGNQSFMNNVDAKNVHYRRREWFQLLNGPYHAQALWIFMLVIVAHWMEHVLQIYQIYGLGWAPADAGGLLGVVYPQLVESEILHFVYDFIQWGGIVLLYPGFRGRARTFWGIATIIQTWHYIEHVLLMGQYMSGNYLFGAAQQISIGQLWFPRAELHFFYNLFVFMPMVIAVHFYLQPKLASLAGASATPSNDRDDSALGTGHA
jgi:hypothetical protein